MNNNTEISPAKSIITERFGVVSITVPLSNSKAGIFVMKKKCTKCGIEKDLSEFRRVDDKPYCHCRDCERIYRREHRKSKKRVIYSIYYHQKHYSGYRGHNPPTYSQSELYDWCISQDKFNELYDAWAKSDYNTNKIPSVDRKDDSLGYSFDNIQLMTWEDNRNKSYKNVYVPVVKLDMDGNYVGEYKSMAEAERVYNISHGDISKCCSGICKSLRGYKWMKKSEWVSFSPDQSKSTNK